MMTGQILGGTPPELAALYQIAIAYLIAATATVSTLVALTLAVLAATDRSHCLLSSRLRPRGGFLPALRRWSILARRTHQTRKGRNDAGLP